MVDLDEGFEPVPVLSEPADPDNELSLQEALAAGATPATLQADPPVPLGRAPAYDFAQRRMVPGVAGGPLMTRGLETLRTWVEKCQRTRRGENPAVDPGFGVDILAEDVLEEGQPFDPSLIAEYIASLERGLTRHPRITGISDVDIDGSPDDDAVTVSYRVATNGDDLADFLFSTAIGA